MKIERRLPRKSVLFSSIPQGGVFEAHNIVYLKTELLESEGEPVNAVGMADGSLCDVFEADDYVIHLPDARLVLGD